MPSILLALFAEPGAITPVAWDSDPVSYKQNVAWHSDHAFHLIFF
jgi:hypothetical protein